MKRLLIILSCLLFLNVKSQTCTLVFDNMETYTWFGDWNTIFNTGFYNNASISPTLSGVLDIENPRVPPNTVEVSPLTKPVYDTLQLAVVESYKEPMYDTFLLSAFTIRLTWLIVNNPVE